MNTDSQGSSISVWGSEPDPTKKDHSVIVSSESSGSSQLRKALTLGNLYTEYEGFELKRVSEKYRVASRECFDRFVLWLNGRNPEKQLIPKYIDYLFSKELTPKTVHTHRAHLVRFFGFLHRFGYTQEKFWEYFPRIRLQNNFEVKAVTNEEYQRLMAVDCDKDLKWCIVCGYWTGLRLGDVCTMRWSQIDFDEQFINKPQNKHRHRGAYLTKIPILSGTDLYHWLRDLEVDDSMPEADVDYVCSSLALRYIFNMRTNAIPNSMGRIFKRAGIEGKSYKHLRSGFESRLANSGVNLALAAKITGRRDIRSLMRYVIVDPDAAREAVGKAMSMELKGFK